MTVTPLPLGLPTALPGAPAGAPAGAAAAADAGTSAGGFGALVAALVAAGTPGAPGGLPVADAEGAGGAGSPVAHGADEPGASPEDAATELPQPDPAAGPTMTPDPTALLAAELAAPALTPAPAPVAVGAGEPSGHAAAPGTATATATDVEAARGPASLSTLAPGPGTAGGPTLPLDRPLDRPVDPPTVTPVAGVALSPGAGDGRAAADVLARVARPASAEGAATAPGATGDPTAGAGPAAPVVPGTASSPPTGTGAATGSPTSTAVARQVFPEVTRLAAGCNGTHRLTLRLDPGSLGEVRVTLTVRDGSVRVSLAAGTEAAEALQHTSPELRRLLELGGAGDATVTIRDLAGSPSVDRSSTRDDAGAGWLGPRDSSPGDPGPQRGPAHDQHAGTRGGSTARDGSQDTTNPSGPVEPRTSAGPSVLDVRM